MGSWYKLREKKYNAVWQFEFLNIRRYTVAGVQQNAILFYFFLSKNSNNCNLQQWITILLWIRFNV